MVLTLFTTGNTEAYPCSLRQWSHVLPPLVSFHHCMTYSVIASRSLGRTDSSPKVTSLNCSMNSTSMTLEPSHRRPNRLVGNETKLLLKLRISLSCLIILLLQSKRLSNGLQLTLQVLSKSDSCPSAADEYSGAMLRLLTERKSPSASSYRARTLQQPSIRKSNSRKSIVKVGAIPVASICFADSSARFCNSGSLALVFGFG